jgi:putative hydrolase of the HAD superfamily
VSSELPPESADATDPQELIERLRRHAHPLTPLPTDRRAVLTPLPGIRALLFDVYGTLFVSSSGDIASSDGKVRSRAMAKALEAVGLPADRTTSERAAQILVESVHRTHKKLRDGGLEYPEVDIRDIFGEVLADLHARGLCGEIPSRKLCEILAAEYERLSNPTWPMPGLLDTLRYLRERNVSLGIISNAQFYTPLLFPALLNRSLENLGFDPGLCVFSYRLREAKPSPRLFRRALEVLSRRAVEPNQALYVGNDRLNDIRPSARAGMKTALFAGDSRSYRPREADPRIRGVKEDVLLTDLRQLADVLAAD